MTVAVKEELPPDKLGVSVRPYGRTPARWAEDEASPDNAIGDLVLRDEMPGGYKSTEGTLSRNPQLQWSDVDAYADVDVYEPGVESVWQGRMDKAPSDSGGERALKIQAAGHQVALDDNQAVRVGYVNRLMSEWTEPSRAFKIAAAAGGQVQLPMSMETDPTNGLPSISLDLGGINTSQAITGYAMFDAGPGILISAVDYSAIWTQGTGTALDATWILRLEGDSTDAFTNVGRPLGTDHITGAGSGSALGQTFTLGTPSRYLAFRFDRVGLVWANYTARADLEQVAIFGNSGLTPRGVFPNRGFTAKQMLGHAVNNYGAPLTAADEDMDDDGYAIPQAWWRAPVPLSEIVKYLTKFNLYDWFVFEDKRFQLKVPRSYGRKWRTRLSECDLSEVGLDSTRLWESIVVQFTDETDTVRTVGPPGSGADVISTDLQITDPSHPAVRAPVTRRDVLQLKGMSTSTIAIAAGVKFLEDANRLSSAGQATCSGYILDDRGTWRPAAQMRSGDELAIVDAADRSYRKIVGREYTHTSRGAQLDLDAPPEGMDAVLERLDASLFSLGLAGGG